ncbi:MAG TPA: hypothetical protein P5233_16645, partial [Candidatus Paceibacterota bacterium]|nr:hypothetical protein [Candidatus Paceibacterota bacterium]
GRAGLVPGCRRPAAVGRGRFSSLAWREPENGLEPAWGLHPTHPRREPDRAFGPEFGIARVAALA